jgi:hypothetical protein
MCGSLDKRLSGRRGQFVKSATIRRGDLFQVQTLGEIGGKLTISVQWKVERLNGGLTINVALPNLDSRNCGRRLQSKTAVEALGD